MHTFERFYHSESSAGALMVRLLNRGIPLCYTVYRRFCTVVEH